MAASVLNSPRAVEMSIFVVRAFVRCVRRWPGHKALAAKLAQLEQKLETHRTEPSTISSRRSARHDVAGETRPADRLPCPGVSAPKMLEAGKT